MNVTVDTSVWSLALRRNTPNDVIYIVNKLRTLIIDGRVVIDLYTKKIIYVGLR